MHASRATQVAALAWACAAASFASGIDVELSSDAGPPLGYSTWNYFPYKSIDEKTAYAVADALAASGLPLAWMEAGGGARGVFIIDEPCFLGRNPRTGNSLKS